MVRVAVEDLFQDNLHLSIRDSEGQVADEDGAVVNVDLVGLGDLVLHHHRSRNALPQQTPGRGLGLGLRGFPAET